jgi:uncharacterized protein (DUF2336 family)
MSLRGFEKSPAIAPLLVRLHESQKLYSLAGDKSPLAQAEMTSAVSDLLDIELTPRERELLTDVLIALTRQAERDLRAALAERLSVVEETPLRLALHLANDEIAVAAPVLRNSKVLNDLDLIYIIKAKGPGYWQAIADRSKLSPQLIDILAGTKDAGTAVVLSENDRVCLTEYAIGILGEMAKSDENIARPLLSRPEIPESLARSLYAHVGAELKAYLRTYYDVSEPAAVKAAADDIFVEFSDAPSSQFMPSSNMVNAAEKFSLLGMLNMQIMLETLQRGQIATFIAFFARYTGLPVRQIHDSLRETCPKGLAIACRALGVQKADFSRIYLMTNRMRSRDRIINQQDMMEILAYFDKIRPEVAQRIMKREQPA